MPHRPHWHLPATSQTPKTERSVQATMMTKFCGHLGDTNTVEILWTDLLKKQYRWCQIISSCHRQWSELHSLRTHKAVGAHQHLVPQWAAAKSLEAFRHPSPPHVPSRDFLPNETIPFINNFIKLYIQVQFSIYTRFTNLWFWNNSKRILAHLFAKIW